MKKYFKNRHGRIANGAKVRFEVENAADWSGDTEGTLTYEGKKWFIKTKYSGTIQINVWLGAYGETIEEI